MNERIKELAGKANIHFSRIGILDGDPNGSARLVGYSKIEKFAELIVRDCVNTLYQHGWTDAANDMKEHFGVEE